MKKSAMKDVDKQGKTLKEGGDVNKERQVEETANEEEPMINIKNSAQFEKLDLSNLTVEDEEEEEIAEVVEEIDEESSLAQSIASANKPILLSKKPEGSINPIQMQYDIDDEWLRKQYVDKGYSANKIAKALGISYQTVSKILLAHGIVRYNSNEMLRYENQVYSLLMANPDYFIEDVVEKLRIDEPTVRKIYQNMKENGKSQKINEALWRKKNEQKTGKA